MMKILFAFKYKKTHSPPYLIFNSTNFDIKMVIFDIYVLQ